MAYWQTVVVVAALASVACGNGNGDNDSSPPPLCHDVCEFMTQAHCPADDVDDCIAECVEWYDRYPQCDGAHDAAYRCVIGAGAANVECSPSGNARLVRDVCDDEGLALNDCYVQ